jgi:hypothetical protein
MIHPRMLWFGAFNILILGILWDVRRPDVRQVERTVATRCELVLTLSKNVYGSGEPVSVNIDLEFCKQCFDPVKMGKIGAF